MSLYDKTLYKDSKLGRIELHFQSIAGTELDLLPEFTVQIKRPNRLNKMLYTKLDPRLLNSPDPLTAIKSNPAVCEELRYVIENGVTFDERK